MTTNNPLPIFDGHNDTLLRLYRLGAGSETAFLSGSDQGHIDRPRARAGGFGGGFFAVYVPPTPESVGPPKSDLTITADGYEVSLADAIDPAYAQRTAIAVMGTLFRLEQAAAGQIKVVRTADELATCLATGVLAAVLHFEGAEAIDPDLNALYVFHQAGLRSLGLVWSRPNAFGHGVPFRFPVSPDTGPGLTDAGRALVSACNELGIMIDLSHLNEQGFWDVAKLSTAPLVATHTAVHAICASTRNLLDTQLDAIRDSDGMVGCNFHVSDLRPDGHLDADVPLSLLVQHIDYLVERIGLDRVGFGSDYDGATMPRELADVSHLPKLVAALRDHGYDDAALRKLTHENWLRVLRQTWRPAPTS
jgi:membrane dipeptidase